MLRQVKVRTIVDTFKLRKAHRELVFHIHGRFCVMRQLIVILELQVFGLDPVLNVEVPAALLPFRKMLLIRARLHEILHLHLFKFAGTEDEISRSDFIAERLTDSGNTKRNFIAR